MCRAPTTIVDVIEPTQRLTAPARERSVRQLCLAERAETSRGLAEGRSVRVSPGWSLRSRTYRVVYPGDAEGACLTSTSPSSSQTVAVDTADRLLPHSAIRELG